MSSRAPRLRRAAAICGVLVLSGGCLAPDGCLPVPTPSKKPSGQNDAGKGAPAPGPAPLPEGAILRLGDPLPGDPGPGEVKVRRHQSRVTAVAQSPRVGMAATGAEDGTVGVWNVRTGALMSWIDAIPGPVHAIAFSPNSRVIATGRSAASAGRSSSTVHIWEVTTGRLIRALVHSAPVYAVVHSPNGGVFVTGGQEVGTKGEIRPSSIRFWDITTGELLRESYGHLGGIFSLSFSGDGQLLASGGDGGQVHLWDPRTGKSLRTMTGQAGRISAVAFSPKGNLLASSDGQSLWIWNLASGTPWVKQGLERGGLGAVAFFPGGKFLATGGDMLRVWSAVTGEVVKELRGHQGWINDLAISSDGRLLVTGSADQTALVWKFKLGY